MADKTEILDQLYEGHTCSNCGKRFNCKNAGPCREWEEEMSIHLTSFPFQTKSRKLNVNWSQMAESMLKLRNFDAEEELMKATEAMLNGPTNKTDNT